MSELEQFQVSGNAAEHYERYIVPTIFIPWSTDLLERAALQPGERVLDVACGTGVVARHAAQQVGSDGTVTGLDLNPVMLEVARTQAASSDAVVEWHQGDAGALPFDDAAFDVVLCQQGLQFFPDKVKALREMHRVLVPGGRVVISVVRSLEHNPLMRAQYDAVIQYLGTEAGVGVSSVCALGDGDELRQLHTDGGFQDIRIDVVTLTIRHANPAAFIPRLMAGTPLAGAIAALDESTQRALLTDVITALQPYTNDEGLAFPHVAHIVMAHT